MGVGRVIGIVWQAFTKAYQYDLKITAVWEEILGTCSFANFILYANPDLGIREKWLEFYKYALHAYSYWLLIPAIAKIAGEKIEKDPQLWNFFSNFRDYYIIHNRIKQEPEADGRNLEGIAAAFRDFFSPICKGFMIFTGTFFSWVRDLTEAGAHALIQFLKSKKYDIISFIDSIIQEYREYGYRMRTVNIPPEFYYQQRPTLDFDIIVLLSHVKAYETYNTLLQEDIKAEEEALNPSKFYAYLKVDDEIIMNLKPDENGKIQFCLSKEMIRLLRGNYSEIETGGAKREGVLD